MTSHLRHPRPPRLRLPNLSSSSVPEHRPDPLQRKNQPIRGGCWLWTNENHRLYLTLTHLPPPLLHSLRRPPPELQMKTQEKNSSEQTDSAHF